MKRPGFIVISLMTVSLLASCGSPDVSYTLTYTYDNGTTDKYVETYGEDKKTVKPTWVPEYPGHIFDGWFTKKGTEGNPFTFGNKLTANKVIYAHWSNIITAYTVTVKAGEDGEFPGGVTEMSLDVKPNSNLLEDLSIITKPTYIGTKLSQTFNTFTYDNGDPIGEDDKVTSDDIVVKGTYRNKTLEECSWKEIDEISKSGTAKEFFGESTPANPKTKTVMVNNQPHKVRIIGYGEDYTELPEGEGEPDPEKAIGITFEFANLISDGDGCSLATQWNDTNDTSTANHNYLDSSVRMALVGEKQDKGHILWAQKGKGIWSTTSPLYKNRSVLSMLPYELLSVLKTPSKYININDGGWHERTVEDELFLLSPAEMSDRQTYEEPRTTTYSYYKNANDIDRVKKQIEGNYEYTSTTGIPSESGQAYEAAVENYAGYNSKSDSKGGGFLWLRSPCIANGMFAYYCNGTGEIDYLHSFSYAYAIAPAFCV